MKTTKKILSIVLAVMLLVGTVVVGVSADATMVYEKAGSKLVYTATTDKTANEDGVIEVKPGETVKVTAMIQANYYLGTTGSEIFCWTAGFFNTITVNDVETLNYVNNYTLTKKVIAKTAATQLGTGYNKGTHEGYYTSRAYTTDCTSPYDASTATPGYVFTFTVPETATVGATGEFRMPETCSATVATTSRMRQIYAAVNNSATAYGSTSLGSEYPETIDLTGTILNFKVVSAEPEAVLGEIKEVNAADAFIGDTAVVTVKVTGAPESLRVVTPAGETTYSRDDADITATEDGEEWLIEVLVNAASEKATVYANYGEAGETAGTEFTLVGLTYCDYADLDAALEAAADANTENCTSASVAEFNAALEAANAVERNMIADAAGENQAKIDAAAERLNKAITGLTKLGNCDYTDLDEAIAVYEAKLADKDLYTNWAEYEAAYNAAKAVTRDMIADEAGANQKVIDDATAALNAVVLQYKAADYSVVEAAIAKIPEDIDDGKYTSDSVKAVKDAVAAVTPGLYITQQDDVNAMAAAIEDAVAKLVKLGACDYSELDTAIATTPDYTAEYYDAAEYAAYEKALADANAVERDMLADEAGANQAKIDAAAQALADAYNALDPRFVDRTALAEALAKNPEYSSEYYDDAAYDAWQIAVTDGEDTYEALDGEPDTEEFRNEAAAAADAINAAFAKLVPAFIDYSALEEAVALYGKTPEAADAYTEETYGPYEEALFAAQDILANKDENAPASDEELAAEIAAAAKALEDAYNALELAPVAALVIKVTPKQEYFKIGDTVEFDYLVSKTGITKLQIKYSGGSTSTYTRTHSAVNITDNGDGTETWTIATKIGSNEVTAVAKAKEGKVWEKNGYQFSYKTNPAPAPAEDKEVKSVTILKDGEAVTTFTTKDTVVVRIVAGPDTLRIRLVTPGGSTSTYARGSAYQNEDGNWVWDITTRRTTAKTYEYAIHTAGKNNKLVAEGTDLIYTVTTYAPPVGPSTGDKADIVVSATVAKARLLVGDKQTVTVVTDKDALGVRVVDANGSVYYQTKDTALAVDNGDGTLTWTFNIGCNYAATYTFDVEALYSNQWLENGTTVTYRVVY